MLPNNTFLETRIQRLLDGLISVKMGLGVHVQRMLKNELGLYTGWNFKQNVCKKIGKLGTLYTTLVWQIKRFGANLIFIKYIMQSLLARFVSLQEHGKCLLSICFALFVANNL